MEESRRKYQTESVGSAVVLVLRDRCVACAIYLKRKSKCLSELDADQYLGDELCVMKYKINYW